MMIVNNELIKISEDEIKSIIANYYNVRTDNVCLCNDYEFIRNGGDKVINDYIYGIVDLENRNNIEKDNIEYVVNEVERKEGSWIVKSNPKIGWYRVTCSVCGEDVTSTAIAVGFSPNIKVIWDYCPYCGAKMVKTICMEDEYETTV